MINIRTLSIEDIAFSVNLTDTMNWNLDEEDFRFMMKLEPEGCFIVSENSERIGLATTICFGEIGWMGNVIVDESKRGRGVGSKLVKHSIEYLEKIHVKTIGLYSYLERIPLYERLGFKHDSEFIVLKGRPKSPQVANKKISSEVKKKDIQNVIDLDGVCFGANRAKLLKPIISNPNNLCYAYFEDELNLGFIIVKVYDGTAYIGPLVCGRGRSDIALNLLMTVFKRLDGFMFSMCIPKKELKILNFLIEARLYKDFRVARMFYGNPVNKNCVYIAESLERG